MKARRAGSLVLVTALAAGTAQAVGRVGADHDDAARGTPNAAPVAPGTPPTAAVRGRLVFSAARAAVWSEADTAAGAQVQRLLLSGDVKITIGTQDFYAARAVVWIEKVGEGTGEGTRDQALGTSNAGAAGVGGGIYEVAVYFDRVGNPKAPASVSLAADRLPVRAVVEVDARGVVLRFDAATRARPVDAFLDEAEAVREESRRRALTGEPALEGRPVPFDAPTPFRQPVAVDPATAKPFRSTRDVSIGALAGDAAALRDGVARLPFGGGVGGAENAPIFTRQGVVTVAAGSLVYRGAGRGPRAGTGEPGKDPETPPPASPQSPAEERQSLASLLATDGVIVQYVDPRTNRGLQMQAQRVVVFLASDDAAESAAGGAGSFAVEGVAGIYLEGDVLATDGRYSLRAPKIYYDVAKNKALLLDAVFWTFDEDRGLPLYVRADAIRQESLREFSATNARFSTSAFFEPEFTLGAQSMTITRKEVPVTGEAADPLSDPTRAGLVIRGGGRSDMLAEGAGGRVGGGGGTRTVTLVEAADITLNAQGLPIFYLPEFSGDPAAVLLKDVRVENSGANGPALKTRWNLSPVLGYDQAQIDLLAQYYFDRGAGLGIDAAYEDEDSRGTLFALGIVNDGGQDLLKPGTRREWNESTRGIILGEERITFGEHWTLFAEGSYLGDETFVDAFLESMAETRREFTSQINLARRQDNSMFALGARSSLNDFVANEYLLQSKGYSVQKMPEIGYLRQSDRVLEEFLSEVGELWGESPTSPGDVFWTQEYRFSNMAMQFDEVYARERGFDTDFLAQRAFGIDADERLADALRGAGYREDAVNRLDTRHELTAPRKLGPVDVTPFVVGRLTAYDNDFTTFSPAETDNTRLWGSAGLRAATQVQRIDDAVKSEFFDLNRIRHIVEPNVTVWTAGTNIDRADLPVYDEDVENLAEGTMARIGVDQVWQTKRGDPLAKALGKSHTADVFRLDSAFVFSTGDVDPKNPFGRWVEFRPELSNPGNYFTTDGAWQVSSSVAITGGTVYDLDLRQQDRTSAGFLIQHTPRYSSFAELRYLNPLDSTFLDLGTSYQLTQRYRFAGLASYDVSNGGFQGAGGELSRSSDAYTLGLRLSYNNTTDSTSFGFVVKPALSTRKKRTQILDDEIDSANTVTTESVR
jgi:hypothetical protein